MDHGAKTVFTIKAVVLDFAQQLLSGSVIDIYKGNEGAKRWLRFPKVLPAVNTLTCAFFSAGTCEVGAGS